MYTYILYVNYASINRIMHGYYYIFQKTALHICQIHESFGGVLANYFCTQRRCSPLYIIYKCIYMYNFIYNILQVAISQDLKLD